MELRRICVYCGSSPGNKPEYKEAARLVGHTLADQKIGLVYGGGNVGLMGQIARAAMDAGGEVIGVIPHDLVKRDVVLREVTELRVVEDMHERKALMTELSDAFICLPGGFGTFEEFFEALTWAQLGLHHKPCGLLNIDGYFDLLMGFLNHVVAEGFIEAGFMGLLLVEKDPAVLLERFRSYQPPKLDKAVLALKKL